MYRRLFLENCDRSWLVFRNCCAWSSLLALGASPLVSSAREHSGIYFTQALNGLSQPTYGKLLEGQVQRKTVARVGSRSTKGGTEKDLDQLRKCHKCDKRFH